MKKYLISTLALSSILVFGACSELEESEEEDVPEESEGTAEAEEEEPSLSPEELAEEIFGDDLLQNEYNEDENVLSVDVDFGNPWLYGRAQSNAESDITELLEELAALDTVPAASFNFIGEVEDIEGNESEDSALLYEFESETISSIDYEEFDSDELQETADQYWSHEEELEAEAQAEEERLEEEEAEAERLEEEQAAEEERLEQEEAEQDANQEEEISEEGNDDPEDTLNEISEEVFGEDLIEVEYYEDNMHANIYTRLSDNLTMNMTKTGAYIDVQDALEKLQEEDIVDSVYIEHEATFTNSYGEESEGQALTFDFEKQTIDRIDFENFLHGDIPNVADNYWEHQSFSE